MGGTVLAYNNPNASGRRRKGLAEPRAVLPERVKPGHRLATINPMPRYEFRMPRLFVDAPLTAGADAVLDRNQHLVGVISLYALAMQTIDETLAGTAIRWPA